MRGACCCCLHACQPTTAATHAAPSPLSRAHSAASSDVAPASIHHLQPTAALRMRRPRRLCARTLSATAMWLSTATCVAVTGSRARGEHAAGHKPGPSCIYTRRNYSYSLLGLSAAFLAASAEAASAARGKPIHTFSCITPSEPPPPDSIHLAGVGDYSVADVAALPDPCPLPSQLKKRSLNERERLLYAPMSGTVQGRGGLGSMGRPPACLAVLPALHRPRQPSLTCCFCHALCRCGRPTL